MPNVPLPPAPEIPAETAAAPVGWLRRRVLAPLVGLLRQGLAPEQLALTVALGVALGLVPFLGAIAPVATVAALALRLNMAALQLVSHLMTPLQLLLLLPLLRLGASLLGGASAQNLTVASLHHLISTDWRRGPPPALAGRARRARAVAGGRRCAGVLALFWADAGIPAVGRAHGK